MLLDHHHPGPTVSRGWLSPARLCELVRGLLYCSYYSILLYISLNQPFHAVGFRQLGYASWRGDCCIILFLLYFTPNQLFHAVGFRQLGYASWRGDRCIILFYYTSPQTNCFARLGSASSAMRVGVGIVVSFLLFCHTSPRTNCVKRLGFANSAMRVGAGTVVIFYFIIHLPEPTVSRGWVPPARLCELARGLLYYSILLYISLNQPCHAVGFRQLGYASWRGDCCIVFIILSYITLNQPCHAVGFRQLG